MTGILLVSNGYGEAAIAGYVARAIHKIAPDAAVEHFPMVGRMDSTAALPSIGPQALMPSGGLVAYWNVRNWARDARAGLLGLTVRQFAFLARQRTRSVVVAIGDVYCAAACLWFARRPTIFVATAKSELVAGHSALERAIARRATLVFTRDAMTATALDRAGVRARYAGNLMMDGIAAPDAPLPLRADALHVGVLPGSRADAPANAGIAIRRLRLVAERLAPRRIEALVSLAPTVESQDLLAACARAGAELRASDEPGIAARGAAGPLDVLVVAGRFGELLRASDIVLGQAGTGNEQAAGLGKPVIASSPGGDPGRVGWYRMRQRRLLGEALAVLPDDDAAFADGVVALLADQSRMEAMGAQGRARMGSPGGSEAVAKAVLALASEKAG
jgi:uncharacterized protein (TIGR03492 family)